MAKKKPEQVSVDILAGRMQPMSSENEPEHYTPIIKGEKEEDGFTFDLSKDQWSDPFRYDYSSPYTGKYFRGSLQDPSQKTIQGENQPWTSKLVNGLAGHTLATGTKFGTMLSELGGATYDAITNLIPNVAEARKAEDGTYFPHMFENFLTKSLKYLEDDLIEQKLLPVYGGQKYYSDNLLNKMGDMKFWSSDLADAVAFSAAAFLGTAGMGAIAKGLKMTKVVGDVTKLSTQGKMFQALGATLFNTIGEAAYEGYDQLQTLRETLATKYHDKPYSSLNKEQQSEINQEAGPYAANVFKANSGLLLGPNLIQTLFFIGPIKDSSTRIMKAVRTGKLDPKDISILKSTLKKGGIGIVSEGLWEEGLQNAVQNYEKSRGDKTAYMDRIPGYAYEWLKGFDTTEGQQSMLLGAFIGLGMGSYRGAVDAIGERKVCNRI